MTVFEQIRLEATAMRDAVDRLSGKIDGLQTKLHTLEVNLVREIGDVKSDLMKWSFVFWVGAVAAIAVLAGVLRR